MDAWRERYPRPPTPRQLRVLAELVAEADAPGVARALREAPAGADALGHVMARDRADARRLQADERRLHATPPSGARGGMAPVAAVLPTVVAPALTPSTEELQAERQRHEAERQRVQAEEEALEAVAVQARRRAMAVAVLREGLAGPKAEELRARYGITAEELRG